MPKKNLGNVPTSRPKGTNRTSTSVKALHSTDGGYLAELITVFNPVLLTPKFHTKGLCKRLLMPHEVIAVRPMSSELRNQYNLTHQCCCHGDNNLYLYLFLNSFLIPCITLCSIHLSTFSHLHLTFFLNPKLPT